MRLIIADGGNPKNMIAFDSKGSLHCGREDIKNDKRNYRKWEICEQTNPNRVATMEEAMTGADVFIGLSTPGPDTVKRAWIKSMAPKSIVFACANPVPEIWPYAAKEEGAFIVATARGDFPNQVNNSVCFPGILKGALLVRAKKITDGMVIRCAHSIAEFSEKRGINSEDIIANMSESEIYAVEAADVAMQAVKEGVARLSLSWDEVYKRAKADIEASHALAEDLKKMGYIKEPPVAMLEQALKEAIASVRS
jgi:malate dehydrogenase (oxaloacetate-decarboxylating)